MSRDRSMVEAVMLASLGEYLVPPTRESERQLAALAIDLIELAGDDPRIVKYLNQKAGSLLDGGKAWGS